jgi:hypothetical protein
MKDTCNCSMPTEETAEWIAHDPECPQFEGSEFRNHHIRTLKCDRCEEVFAVQQSRWAFTMRDFVAATAEAENHCLDCPFSDYEGDWSFTMATKLSVLMPRD